jgi:hypothetical protein
MNLWRSRRSVRLERLIRRYRAVLILARRVDPGEKALLDELLAAVSEMGGKALIEREAFYTKAFEELRAEVGLIADPDEVVEWVEDAERHFPQVLYVSKHALEHRMFSRFAADGRFRNWGRLPPHARIGIDVTVSTVAGHMRFDWRLLEASLFEDVAMLWNEVAGIAVTSDHVRDELKLPIKRFHVLTRSLVRAAFALLEGYMNGIAVDVLMTRDDLTEPHRELLAESRGPHRTFAPVKLRDKILQYPKLALRREHPVVHEDSCPELATVLRYERLLRDSLMHPTARHDIGRESTREEQFFNASLEDARAIVDAVAGLIRRIDIELNGQFGQVSEWLCDRGTDDKYPKEAFY